MPLVLARIAYVGEGGPCPICQTPTDAYGDHHVSCGGKGTEYTCTTQIGNVLFFAVQSAAVAPWKQGPSLIPSFSGRPADVLAEGLLMSNSQTG